MGGLVQYGETLDVPKTGPEVKVAFGPISIRGTVELKTESDSVIVWAVGTGQGADLTKQAEVQEMLKTAPWVLVLRLTVRK